MSVCDRTNARGASPIRVPLKLVELETLILAALAGAASGITITLLLSRADWSG